MPTYDVSVHTDQNGYFQQTQVINPPGPFGLAVGLRALRTDHVETMVQGCLDIDAVDVSPSNPERAFSLASGWETDLGTWKLDGGDNTVIVRGKTTPPAPDQILGVRLTASLAPTEPPALLAAPAAAELISSIKVEVRTTTDNKEDSQFELIVKQGAQEIWYLRAGAGENWDEGDNRTFTVNPNVPVTGEVIEVVAALQDGPWGQSNHWDCNLKLDVGSSRGRAAHWDNGLAFRTAGDRRRHEFNLGTRWLQ